MRILAYLCASLLVFGLAAFDISMPDRGGGLAAGMFAGAAVYDISSGFLAYFAPCWIALARSHRELPAIVVLNLLLGWTVVGWLAAMIWALARLSAEPPPAGRSLPQ
jgi:hypothetical protein